MATRLKYALFTYLNILRDFCHTAEPDPAHQREYIFAMKLCLYMDSFLTWT